MRWHRGYAGWTAALLLFEIGIALFVDDRFVRPFGGDAIAVVLVYAGLRAITRLNVATALLIALATAVAIEFGQLFGLVDRIGLGGSAVARVVLGTGYDPRDFLAYAAGTAAVAVVEAIRRRSASGLHPRRDRARTRRTPTPPDGRARS